jgi:hypothetical protein
MSSEGKLSQVDFILFYVNITRYLSELFKYAFRLRVSHMSSLYYPLLFAFVRFTLSVVGHLAVDSIRY